MVTRAAEQSETLVQALREKGAVPVLLPLVVFAPPDEPGLLDGAIRGMASYDWLFLTSQNAVRALQERSEILGVSLPQATAAVRIAAVGPATAEAVKHAGLKVEYVAAKHQGTAMAEELAERVKGRTVLLPRSDRANPELVEKLKTLGASVTEIVAYKTVRPEESVSQRAEDLVRDGADAVLFFSPSAVHHFRDSLGDAKFLECSRHAVFAAIGPVTEEAMQKAKVERVLVAPDTSVGAVVTALMEYFSAEGAKSPVGAKPQ